MNLQRPVSIYIYKHTNAVKSVPLTVKSRCRVVVKVYSPGIYGNLRAVPHFNEQIGIAVKIKILGYDKIVLRKSSSDGSSAVSILRV